MFLSQEVYVVVPPCHFMTFPAYSVS